MATVLSNAAAVSSQQEWHRHRAGASRPDAKAWLDYPAMGFGMLKTVWPSGLRRWLKAPFRKGVGSNPTAVKWSAAQITATLRRCLR